MGSAALLFIVRHAHREKRESLGSDNGLSEKGQAQARALADWFERAGVRQAKLVSSPRVRCQETLSPLAARWRRSLEVDSRLDEQGDESHGAFLSRIRGFAESCQDSPVTVASTHGDWIPAFFESVCGSAIDLAKGAVARVEIVEGRYRVREVVQVPK